MCGKRQVLLAVCLLLFYSHYTAAYQVAVKLGSQFELSLPSVHQCGQYTLLSPLLRPIVIVEGANTTNMMGDYTRRASVVQTQTGFKFTLFEARQSDMGRYKVASSAASRMGPEKCVDKSFFVTVISANDEYFKPWSEWSTCTQPCSPQVTRTRSRACTLAGGGCTDMGPTFESQPCNHAENCGRWSQWGHWSACSAKCGKGFKMRKRACISGNSVLVKASLCSGHATQSHMCLTVCEVVGTWSEWGDWSLCSNPCGRGSRNRVRSCSTDTLQRVTTKNCTGNKTEQEDCHTTCIIPPPITNNTLAVIDINTGGMTSEEAETTLSITSMVAGIACAITVIVIIIVMLLLKHRNQRRRESVPTLRPAEDASKRRGKKTSKTSNASGRSSVDPAAKAGSGNFYSELTSSNMPWPSSDFDSYASDNDGFNPDRENIRNEVAALENIAEAHEEDGDDISNDSGEFDHEFDDTFPDYGIETMCERKEITYSTSRVSFVRPQLESASSQGSGSVKVRGASVPDEGHVTEDSEDELATENVYYEPPELWSGEDAQNGSTFNSMTRDSCKNNINGKERALGYGSADDDDRIYYEPPVGDGNSIANKKDTKTAGTVPELMNPDSVYENCEVEDGVIKSGEGKVEPLYEPIADHEEEDTVWMEKVKANSTAAVAEERIYDDPVTPVCNCPRYSQVLENSSLSRNGVRREGVVAIDLDKMFTKEDLDSDHMYINGKVNNTQHDYYVTPKYSYGGYGAGEQGSRQKKESTVSIYDVPK